MMSQSSSLLPPIRRHGLPGTLLPGFLLLAATLTCHSPAAAQRPPRDAVQEFRDALKVDRDTFSKEAMTFREESLRKAADKVQAAGDLAQILLLQDWLFDADRATLKIIGDRLEEKLRGDLSLKESDPTRRTAAMILIRETVVKSRTIKGVRNSPLVERMANVAPELIQLIEAPRVGDEERSAAIAALGEIEPVFYRPDPDAAQELLKPKSEDVESLLKKQLQSNQLEIRRAAARSLAEFTQGVILFAEKNNQVSGTSAGERLRSEQRKEMAEAYRIKSLAGVLDTATAGLNDADAEVRRTCVEACKTVSLITSNLIAPVGTDRFPPEGRPWTKAERELIESRRREVTALRGLLAPLLEAYQKAVPALAQAASSSPDASVRVEANHVLENLAFARQKLVKLEDRIPKDKTPPEQENRPEVTLPRVPVVFSSPNVAQSEPPVPVPARQVEALAVGRPVAYRPADPAPDTLASSLRTALASVQKSLCDPDKKVRLAAIDVLERFGDDAAPALPALVQALGDSDKFVRWSAARVIGKMAPIQPSVAVPKLAELTADPDLDVRLAAIGALERYGAAAKGVVNPYLGNAATHGDAEARIAAMKALQAIGADAAPALPAVATNLNAEDQRLRQAACETLGLIGPLVAKANPALWKEIGPKLAAALRQALGDDTSEVRLAASDALLKVLGK